MKHPTFSGYGPIVNRLGDVLDHIDRYSFVAVKRLAEATGVSYSSVSRIINNQVSPTFAIASRVTAAIEKELGMRIDLRDIFAENGEFLTRSVCDLTACPGCLPDNAMDEFGETKHAFADVTPGTWVTSRYPKGYVIEKGIIR